MTGIFKDSSGFVMPVLWSGWAGTLGLCGPVASESPREPLINTDSWGLPVEILVGPGLGHLH